MRGKEITVDDKAWPRRQFRAPQHTDGLLVEPRDSSPLSLMATNRQSLQHNRALIGKEKLADLRLSCRRDVLRNACEYTARLRGVRPEMPSLEDDLVVVGHQPGLFHPGVWLKHWTAGAIAQQADGVALNVIIDNDLCESVDVNVPVGPMDSPSTVPVSLDDDFQPRPWEDVRLKNPATFLSAGERLCTSMTDWGFEPIACDAWEQLDPVDENSSLVDQLSQIRHRAQQAGGLNVLEVPMRNIARLPSFAQFVAHVIQNIASLSSVYNEGLAVYRKLNKLRSESHPMPDLGRQGKLFETPLWVWRAGDVQRRPLWARLDGCGVRLFDDPESTTPIAVVRDGDCDWDVWHRMLTDLDHQGYRVRPRALMTTLFLRVCLADLFIHGIGGAKYDEVTDWIIRQFIGLEAPQFLTVSGTARLPIEHNAVTPSDVTLFRRKIRDIQFNPDRHGATGPLVDEKETLIAEQRDAANGHGESRQNYRRFLRLREINQLLAEQIRDDVAATQAELANCESHVKASKVLGGREFSWTLFERESLFAWLEKSSQQIACWS